MTHIKNGKSKKAVQVSRIKKKTGESNRGDTVRGGGEKTKVLLLGE